ncbi:bardet-Biedl syndrome 5 protein [Planoprotostelium fungivorum]|uniref:Bardet-Biedl syndrome 5 protein n=1 Tax=Planoprotostelium fungivorum TaxID=1890364 RepID=A0A2P6NT99_9EUKA|nr:bardet-Biedl syndrome 5 protein [Planoprotostelium fungivorum]
MEAASTTTIAFQYVWQDKEVRFQMSLSLTQPLYSDLQCRPGEVSFFKDGRGQLGAVLTTNLRLLWVSYRSAKNNISVGYSSLQTISVHTVANKQKKETFMLSICAKHEDNTANLNFLCSNPTIKVILYEALHDYEKTRLFRDLKLRGAIIRDKEPVLLPGEHVYRKVPGIWNLSAEQGNLGTFVITNVRLVWFANLITSFNASIPYMQIKNIRTRSSAFGKALVIETMPQSGGYILGFKIDPLETLNEVCAELQSIHSIFAKEPIFGITKSKTEEADLSSFNFSFLFSNKGNNAQKKKALEEEEEVIEQEDPDALALYYADGNTNRDREPVFNEDLGLAIETLKEGMTIGNLWSVV